MLMSLKKLIGYKVFAIDGQFGQVSDCLISEKDKVVRYLVIDPQKWNPLSQKVLVSSVSIFYVNVDSKELHLSITQEQVKSSPGVEEYETVSRHFEAELYRRYGYGYYWMGTDLWGVSSDPTLLKLPEQQPDSLESTEQQIDLRSTNEVTGYRCECADGSEHGFYDFVVNTKNWSLPYCVVDVDSALLNNNLAVVKNTAIKAFSWQEQKVAITLNKHQLSANPHFDPKAINSDEFLAMMEASPVTA